MYETFDKDWNPTGEEKQIFGETLDAHSPARAVTGQQTSVCRFLW